VVRIPALLFPNLEATLEAVFAQRCPHAPDERLLTIDDGKFQTASNEEVFFVNHAEVVGQIAPRLTFGFGDVVVKGGSVGPEFPRRFIMVLTTGFSEEAVVHSVDHRAVGRFHARLGPSVRNAKAAVPQFAAD
jgi:hypothetical protein